MLEEPRIGTMELENFLKYNNRHQRAFFYSDQTPKIHIMWLSLHCIANQITIYVN